MLNLDVFTSLLFLVKLATIGYVVNKNHVINNLMVLEFIVMIVLAIAVKMMTNLMMEMYIIFFLMILMIAESVVGLSILIYMIRTHSNDYMKSSAVSLF